MDEITKAIIPVAGLGARFLPLSLALSKEFFPLADKPVIQYIIDEMRMSGIKEITFVVSPKQKMIMNYFKKSPELEKLLLKRHKEKPLEDLRQFEETFKDITFSYVTQKQPHGDGDAIYQAYKSLQMQGPVAISFGDDVIYSQEPAISQLINVFKTCNAPVMALKSVSGEFVSAYGNVAVEKIATNLYKIKKIVEKPDADNIQSNLVIVGKYVLTPEVFEYLKKAEFSEKGEIILGEVFGKMLDDGMPIYGCEVKGEWLECGDKLKWMKSFMYVALRDPVFGRDLREYLRMVK